MKNITTYTYKLEWRGITIEISYAPRYFSDSLAHLDIRSINPEKAVLPFTETGCRSHFFPTEEMLAYDSPVEYVQAWLDEAAKSKDWIELQEKSKQMSFF